MKISKRILQSVVIYISFFSLLGCSNPDKKSNELFVEASKLIDEANKANSYSDGFNLYNEALNKINRITTEYPSSQLAVNIAKGDLNIGSISIKSLKEKILPEIEEKAQYESNPLNCALFVTDLIKRLETRIYYQMDIAAEYCKKGDTHSFSKIVLPLIKIGNNLDDKISADTFFHKIVQGFLICGQVEQAIDIINMMNDAEYKYEALADVASKYAELKQIDRAIEILNKSLMVATEIAKYRAPYATWIEVKAMCYIAEKYWDIGQNVRTIELINRAKQLAVDANKIPDNINNLISRFCLQRIAKVYQERIKDNNEASVLLTKASQFIDYGEISSCIEIAGQLHEIGEKKLSIEILMRALNTANKKNDDGYAILIADKLYEFGEDEKANELVNQFISEIKKAKDKMKKCSGCFDFIIKNEKKEIVKGNLTLAADVVNSSEYEKADIIQKNSYICNLGKCFSEIGQIEKALDLIRNGERGLDTADTLIDIGANIESLGQKEKASEIFSEALDESYRLYRLYEKGNSEMFLFSVKLCKDLISISIKSRELNVPINSKMISTMHEIVKSAG